MTIYQSSDHRAFEDPDSPQSRADASYNGVSDHPGSPDEQTINELLLSAELNNSLTGSNWRSIELLIAAVRLLSKQ